MTKREASDDDSDWLGMMCLYILHDCDFPVDIGRKDVIQNSTQCLTFCREAEKHKLVCERLRPCPPRVPGLN